MNQVLVHRNVVFSPQAGERGYGDIIRPVGGYKGVPIILIHGGGWNNMRKENLEPVGQALAECGRVVFNVGYRLIDHAPWPACWDDCVAGARFVLAGGLRKWGVTDEQVEVWGASAGGHLAMMTGLKLGRNLATRIVSMAGPSRVDFPTGTSSTILASQEFRNKFFGGQETPEKVRAANPVNLVTPDAPPLICIHSTNDRLVPITHSQDAVQAWHTAGLNADMRIFDGPGNSHGFWDSNDLTTRKLIPVVANLIKEIGQPDVS